MVPTERGEAACQGGTGLQPSEALVIVVFGGILGGNHSMLFTTDGIGNFWKWEAVCKGHGNGTCNGVTTSGQLYFQETYETGAMLRNDHPGLGDNDANGFYYIVRSPVQQKNALIRAFGSRVNAANLNYLLLTRNCHTFTHTALEVLGLQSPPEPLLRGRGWYDNTLQRYR
jgi:hypothetical protein